MIIAPKIAIIHDWLVASGGAEKVLEAMLEVWPQADIYTIVYDQDGPCRDIVEGHKIETSFIQKLPWVKKKYRAYLPIMPLAIEQFDLRKYDVIISNSYAVAHGIIPQAHQLHINNICIPVRYAWNLYQQYLDESGLSTGVKGAFAKIILHYLRLWDLSASHRVDYFVAISKWVAQNVWRTYRRHADVIYPPVDIDDFIISKKGREDFYLTSSRIVPYKKIDLIVEAFSKMGDRKLIVIGDGPDLGKLEAIAGPNTKLLGFIPKQDLINYMQRAKAFVFAADEDFGIVPVEAQACGTPVIAYKHGGVLETIVEGNTGIFFEEQNVDSLINAVYRFEDIQYTFDPVVIRENAERFNKVRFKNEIQAYVDQKMEEFKSSHLFISRGSKS